MLVSGEVAIREKRSGKQPADRNFVRRSGFWRDGFSQRRGGFRWRSILGESILWRIDRADARVRRQQWNRRRAALSERYEHLSGRLVDGNKKVVDMGRSCRRPWLICSRLPLQGHRRIKPSGRCKARLPTCKMRSRERRSKIKSNWVAVAAWLPCLVPSGYSSYFQVVKTRLRSPPQDGRQGR